MSGEDPAVWVNSRQYTGRLVTVTNGAIFNEPVYNYTRDFPYLWEEIVLPGSSASCSPLHRPTPSSTIHTPARPWPSCSLGTPWLTPRSSPKSTGG